MKRRLLPDSLSASGLQRVETRRTSLSCVRREREPRGCSLPRPNPAGGALRSCRSQVEAVPASSPCLSQVLALLSIEEAGGRGLLGAPPSGGGSKPGRAASRRERARHSTLTEKGQVAGFLSLVCSALASQSEPSKSRAGQQVATARLDALAPVVSTPAPAGMTARPAKRPIFPVTPAHPQ